MERTPFGTTRDGRAVDKIILDNGTPRCSLLTYGATLRGLVAQGKRGPVDTVLGFDHMEDYEAQDKFMGAVVGRYANRIAGGRFTLDGRSYTLACNDGENHLHGGPMGFFSKVWEAEPWGECGVTFSCESGDMEEGYPGWIKASVTYCLEGGALRLLYRAVTDRTTICNLTNHAYFNLNGHSAGGAMDQLLTLCATPPWGRAVFQRVKSRRWRERRWISIVPPPLAHGLTGLSDSWSCVPAMTTTGWWTANPVR